MYPMNQWGRPPGGAYGNYQSPQMTGGFMAPQFTAMQPPPQGVPSLSLIHI